MEMGLSYKVSALNDHFGPLFFRPKLVHSVEGVTAQFLRKFQSCHLRNQGERVIALQLRLRVYMKTWCPRDLKVIHFSIEKMLSIDHLYAFCRAKKGASAPIMQPQRKVSAMKMLKTTWYGYENQNACRTTHEGGPKIFFSTLVKVEKKYMKTCKNMWAFFWYELESNLRGGQISVLIRRGPLEKHWTF